MQKINTSRSLLALGAIGLAILPLSGAVQAKDKNKNKSKGGPPAHAPAYGRRDRDRDHREHDREHHSGDDRDNDYDYDQDRDNGRNGGRVRPDSYGRLVTLEGVVTRADDFNNNGTGDFRVQAGGRSFDVVSDTNVRVRVGQRVILRGSFNQDNDFNARSVNVIGRDNDNRNDNDPNGNDYNPGTDRRVNFPGVVTRVFSNGELEVRAGNGSTYRVDPRSDSSDSRVGDRVRVTGTATGNRVENARLSVEGSSGRGGILGGIFGSGGIFGNGGSNSGADYGDSGNSTNQKVSFSARIVRISSDRRSATVRGDNGREYTVRSSDLKNYRSGERVRVRGTSRYGVIQASDIDRI